jgi:hypothetical protein
VAAIRQNAMTAQQYDDEHAFIEAQYSRGLITEDERQEMIDALLRDFENP